MPRHLIHSMKIKDIKIALDHYLNPLQKCYKLHKILKQFIQCRN